MSIQEMQDAFKEAAKRSLYLNTVESAIKASKEKGSRLSQVFADAENHLKNVEGLHSKEWDSLLKHVEIIYARYSDKTQGWLNVKAWMRWVSKFFSSKYRESEEATQIAYYKLQEMMKENFKIATKKEVLEKTRELFNKTVLSILEQFPSVPKLEEVTKNSKNIKEINANKYSTPRTLPSLVNHYKKRYPDLLENLVIPYHAFMIGECVVNSFRARHDSKDVLKLNVTIEDNIVFEACCRYVEDLTEPKTDSWNEDQKKIFNDLKNELACIAILDRNKYE